MLIHKKHCLSLGSLEEDPEIRVEELVIYSGFALKEKKRWKLDRTGEGAEQGQDVHMVTAAHSHSYFEGDPAFYTPLSSSYCMQAGNSGIQAPQRSCSCLA